MTPVERLEFFRKTVVTGSNEEVQISSCGPWCDVWSLGRTILDLCQGKHDKAKGRYQDVSINSNFLHVGVWMSKVIITC